MKTWEEFVKQGERSRFTRPGDDDFSPYNAYLGITKEMEKYEIFTHPEEIERDLSLFRAGEHLCDLLTKYACLSWDINFSDNINEEEASFWRKLCSVAQERGRCGGRLNDALEEAASYRPAAIKAANAGLSDKWR